MEVPLQAHPVRNGLLLRIQEMERPDSQGRGLSQELTSPHPPYRRLSRRCFLYPFFLSGSAPFVRSAPDSLPISMGSTGRRAVGMIWPFLTRTPGTGTSRRCPESCWCLVKTGAGTRQPPVRETITETDGSIWRCITVKPGPGISRTGETRGFWRLPENGAAPP